MSLWVAEQLRTHGCVDRAYLGVRLEPGSATDASHLSEPEQRRLSNLTDPRSDPEPASTGSDTTWLDDTFASTTLADGAILYDVLAGTPAAAAGLRPGDKIIALNGRTIRSTRDLTERLDHIPARTTILLSVVRRVVRDSADFFFRLYR